MHYLIKSHYFKLAINFLLGVVIAIMTQSVQASTAVEQSANNYSTTNKALEQRYIPRLHRSVNFFGLGALEIGRDWGIGTQERIHLSAQNAKQTLQTALQSGITVIDTASSYHNSEAWIGEFAAPDKNKFLLISKPGESSVLATDKSCKVAAADGKYCSDPAARYDFSRAAIRHDVEESLKNLKVKQLDVALIHFSDEDAKEVLDKGEAVAALKELQREGKVKYMGVSIDGDLARRCIESNEFDVIEMEYNLLNQSNKENIALAHAKGMGVIIRGGLGTGLLTPKVQPYLNDPDLPYAKQVKALLQLTGDDFKKLLALELNFLYQNKGISSVIVGAGRPDYIKEDMQLLNNFNDPALLQQAEALMSEQQGGPYTYMVDAYFAKQIK
jgi:aryl-alcohol dehydrogenase-like predicted oxidoreductase